MRELWDKRDPIGFRGGINLYGYVANSPVDLFDLLGLAPGDQYPNANAAAEAGEVGPLTADTGWEWGSWIVPDGNDGYTYTPPETSMNPEGVELGPRPGNNGPAPIGPGRGGGGGANGFSPFDDGGLGPTPGMQCRVQYLLTADCWLIKRYGNCPMLFKEKSGEQFKIKKMNCCSK